MKNEPILPLTMDPDLDPRLVALGDRLFHDKRLSQDNSLSCASCHLLSSGGTDKKPRSMGVGGAMGVIKRCQPGKAKRRLVVPGSREAILETRRAVGA
ncbi:MAG: cytochrome-c peroxidase, partial [Candidatus Thiodiazotropha sp.]